MRRQPLTRTVLLAVARQYGSTCWLCEQPIQDEAVSGDHVQPVTYGGGNDLENLRPAHAWCNRQRGEWCVPAYYAWALTRGDDDLVPARLREALKPGAQDLAARARVYYSRATRYTPLRPLTGSWHCPL